MPEDTGVVLRYGPIAVGECFFHDPEPPPPVDLLRLRQVGSPTGLIDLERQATRVVDLRRDTAELFAALRSGARNEIRRCERDDGVACRLRGAGEIPDDTLDSVLRDFAVFARARAIRPINRQRLERLREAGRLWLGEASGGDGAILCRHVYLVQCGRARLLHSLSGGWQASGGAERARAGRINRCLHWHDMLAFRHLGVERYDLGGIVIAPTDPVMAGITRFKCDFGGETVVEFNGLRPLSIKGRMALTSLQAVRGLRRAVGRLRPGRS
jgi:hypothetical protein